MTSDFKFQNYTKPHSQGDLPTLKIAGNTNQSMGTANMLKRDRFELLSAYLDGEVTAAERQQVEEWLKNDSEIQRLYARLLKVRSGLQTLPVPPAQQPVERTLEQVFAHVDRRYRMATVWGGSAIAALVVSAFSSILPNQQQFIAPQLAQSIDPTTASAESLMVALNTPVVEIPKAALVAPEKVDQQTGSKQQIKGNVN